MHNIHMNSDRKCFCLPHIEMLYKWRNAESTFSSDAESVISAQTKGIQTGRETAASPNLSPSGLWGFLGNVTDLHGSVVFVIAAVVLWVFFKHQDTPIVKANNWALSYVLLLFLLLCLLCSLCSLLFIGHPNTATCALQQITLGVVFTMAVATVLVNTLTVILAFKVRKPRRTMRWFL